VYFINNDTGFLHHWVVYYSYYVVTLSMFNTSKSDKTFQSKHVQLSKLNLKKNLSKHIFNFLLISSVF